MLVCAVFVVLEWVVVSAVGGNGNAIQPGRLRAADRYATGEGGRRKSALEPAPSDALFIQQVADVPAQHRSPVEIARAIIVKRVCVADHSPGGRIGNLVDVGLEVTKGIVLGVDQVRESRLA